MISAMNDAADAPLHLLTGATGYVGGALLPRLQESGAFVRCLVRNPAAAKLPADPRTEVVGGDVLDPESLSAAMQRVDVAWYLIHSMGGRGDFQALDQRAAGNFRDAAARCGVKKIIYLGGLGRDSDQLSAHLRSRQHVGEILRKGPVPCVEFRAAMIIGRGSLSFCMVRHLCNRLPIMICPSWLSTETQPLASSDLLEYLMAAAVMESPKSQIVEIGSPDVVSYREIIREYARQLGMRRLLIPVPVLTPYLSSLWLGLVTPETAAVGRDLIESLKNPTIVTDPSTSQQFPVRPRTVAAAIQQALAEPDSG